VFKRGRKLIGDATKESVIDSMPWPKPMHPGLWNTVNFDAVRGKIESIKTAVQISQ